MTILHGYGIIKKTKKHKKSDEETKKRDESKREGLVGEKACSGALGYFGAAENRRFPR